MSIQSKAAVLYEAGKHAIIEEVTIEAPHQGGILVRM